MKRVVSVSLGSSKRDHKVEKEILGETFSIERRGTDGDLQKTKALFQELDGHVDALGLGGMNLYITAGKQKYYFRQARNLIKNIQHTPVVDGNGLKDTLERRVVNYMQEELAMDLQGKRALIVCAVDRYGMAEAFSQAGVQTIFGDLIFALNVPIPIKTLAGLRRVSSIVAPLIVNLPFHLIYPVGKAQDRESKRVHNRYYEKADIIAGDYHYIKKYYPRNLDGKILVTNTVTNQDLEKMKELGVQTLITMTPDLEGRSFGTNVLEAVLVAHLGLKRGQVQPQLYDGLLDAMGLTPRVVQLTNS